MIIEITEEEREFLHRMCMRARLLSKIMDVGRSFETNEEAILNLICKLKMEKDHDH